MAEFQKLHIFGVRGASSDACAICGFVKPSAFLDLKQLNEDLLDRINQMSSDSAELSSNCEALRTKNTELLEKINQMSSDSAELSSNCASLRAQNAELQDFISNMSGDGVRLASENAALKLKVNELSANSANLQLQLSKKIQTVLSLNSSIDELNKQIEELKKQGSGTSGGGASVEELNKAKEEAKQLTEEKLKLQLQIDNYVAFFTPPTKPTEKVIAGNNKIKISWTKEEGATHYQIYYKRKGTPAQSIIVDGKNNSKTIKKLKSSKKYTIKTRAIKKESKTITYGTWSTAKTVRVK